MYGMFMFAKSQMIPRSEIENWFRENFVQAKTFCLDKIIFFPKYTPGFFGDKKSNV